MRIAVYGGSFNPPHVGHLMVAAWLRWTDRADRVWLLPALAHPFAKDLAPFAERVALCEAVAGCVDGLEVCTVEGELPEPSYTIDTLTELRRRHPDHTFRLIVGADVLPETPRWKRWDAIEAQFDPILVGRQGWPEPMDAVAFPGVSSTDIRARARAGAPLEHLVPAAIVERVRRLYQG